jgi:hypothetical protein
VHTFKPQRELKKDHDEFSFVPCYVRLAYHPPASSIFLSERTSHQGFFSLNKFFFLEQTSINPPATSQTNKISVTSLPR